MATSKRAVEGSYIIRSFTICHVLYIIRAFTSRSMRWMGYEESIAEITNSYIFKSGRSKWKSLLGTLRYNLKNNITFILKE
jgi:hypothetical protein